MKSVVKSLTLFMMTTSILLAAACSPKGGGSPSITDADGGALPVFQGTVSGGGGNGCDGKAMEAYAKKITEMEEYKLFIRPVLRRLTEESADPLITYLLWAAEEKAWYFLPCDLTNLSTSQIGVALKSDQLALHGEHGVYIRAVENEKNKSGVVTYYQKRGKARAALLLHEMVMGARLLMKKPAAEQCKALAKKDSKICSDPELMAIAETRQVDPSQVNVMDAADHEAIRAMTAFLAQRESDFSTENMSATRERLGFVFPWSRAHSAISLPDIAAAFARSRQMQDRFKVAGAMDTPFRNGGRTYIKPPVHPYFKDYAMTCSIDVQTSWGLYMHVWMTSALNPNEGNASAKFKSDLGLQSIGSICEEYSSHIHSSSVSVREGNTITSRSVECEKNRVLTAYDYMQGFGVPETGFIARGVLRDGQMFDEITFNISPWGHSTWPALVGRPQDANRIRILLTRGEAPRLHSLSIEPVQALKASTGEKSSEEKAEFLPIPDVPAIECVNSSLPSLSGGGK